MLNVLCLSSNVLVSIHLPGHVEAGVSFSSVFVLESLVNLCSAGIISLR